MSFEYESRQTLVSGSSLLTLSSMHSMTTDGYFRVSHLKNAGTPMVAALALKDQWVRG